MMNPDSRRPPRLWIMLLIGIPLALADVVLWVLIGIGCVVSENLDGSRAKLCNHGEFEPRLLLPLAGAALVLISIYAARRARRGWIFVLGAVIAAGSGGYMWAIASA